MFDGRGKLSLTVIGNARFEASENLVFCGPFYCKDEGEAVFGFVCSIQFGEAGEFLRRECIKARTLLLMRGICREFGACGKIGMGA